MVKLRPLQGIEATPLLLRLGRVVVCGDSRGCTYRHIFVDTIGGCIRTAVGRHSYRYRSDYLARVISRSDDQQIL